MVATEVNETAMAPEGPEGIPAGNYTLVGWDIDTTGRRLIDDICQIAGFTPNSQFSQYIMPHSNMNPAAIRRHHIRIVTIGRYRMLKDNVTNKVLKTKSEISALTEFLVWLESQKDKTDGVILIYHETRKIAPPMLLKAMMRYNLYDRFKKTVVGFANGQTLATDKCRTSVKSFGLRMMANMLLDKQVELQSAVERASTAYEVAKHLAQGEQQELSKGDPASLKNMVNVVCTYTCSTDEEMEGLNKLKTIIGRQNTFRPVFAPLLFRSTREERLRASSLRNLLVDSKFNYQQLQDIWNDSKLEGLRTELSVLTEKATEEQFNELLEILDCHYDPEKQAKRVKPKTHKPKNGLNKVDNNQAEAEESGSTSPETVSSGSPVKGPEKPIANNNNLSQVTATN